MWPIIGQLFKKAALSGAKFVGKRALDRISGRHFDKVANEK